MVFRSLRHTLAALLVLLFLATGAAAVQVRVTPASSNGVVGSTITVTVEADSVTALGGFQFGFGYSTADLQVVSTTVNPAFDQVVKQDQGTATGSGMIAATVFNNAAVSGTPVTLATIDFKILTPVAGNITLSSVILGQVGGTEIPSTAVGGDFVQTSFNSSNQFSGVSNPNGVWSYGWMPVGFGSLTLYTTNSSGGGFNSWLGNLSGDGTPGVYNNTGTGSPFGIPPGWLSLHPGPGSEPSVLRFTAPFSGTIRIAGQFLPGDSGAMLVAVRVNGQQKWQSVDSGAYDLTTVVNAGDTVDFAAYGGYAYGNTPIDATITYFEPGLSATVPSGLVSWWNGETTIGNVAVDQAGTNNGTFVNGATVAPGKVGNAFSFNGANYIDLTQTVQFNSNDFTIQGWFRTNADTTVTYQQIWMSGYNGGNPAVEIVMQDNKLKFYARDISLQTTPDVLTSLGLNDNNWHHFAAIRNGSNFILYADGAQAASISKVMGDLDAADVVPRIGNGLGTTNNRYFVGSIDELQIYNRALTQAEIQAIYNAGSNGMYASPQTIGSISFSPATLVVGSTTTVSASATSGLTVVFTSTTPAVCTVSGSTVTGVTTGTCTIAADQAGNGTYSAASQATTNLTVTTDSTPPADGILTSTPGDTQVTLTWTPATDNVGVTSYKLVFDSATALATACSSGTQIDISGGQPIVHSGLTNGTTYYYRLCATDAAGNWSSGATTSTTPSGQRYVYVTNSGGNSISVFSIDQPGGGLSPATPPTAATGYLPYGLALDPDGRFAYVANYSSNSIGVYTVNQLTGVLTPAGAAPSLTTPTDVAVDPTGRFVYAISSTTNIVSAYSINQGTGALVAAGQLATGTNPMSVAVEPTGRFVYVANYGSSSVTRYSIDQATGALTSLSSIGSGTNPHMITIDPSGKFAYTANVGSANVSVFTINPSTGALTAGTPVAAGWNTRSVTVDPTGRFAYATNQEPSLDNVYAYTIDQSTGALSTVGTVRAGSNPWWMTYDVTGRFAYVANYSSNNVTIYSIDQSTGALTAPATVSTGTNPYSIATNSGPLAVTPPAVATVAPLNGAVTVPAATTITVTFTKAADPSTITGSTFVVSGATGAVTYDVPSRTATFTPSGNLAYSTVYSATVTTGVKNLAGNSMAASYAWSFTTEAAPLTSQAIGAISFAPASLTVGNTTAVSATATSSLPVSFTSLTPAVCTVSGSTVTGLSAGICTIAADQAGDAVYNVAAQVTQNIAVANPVCTPQVSGLVSMWKGEWNANDAFGSSSGTLQNGATFAPGKVGQAFSFDGVDDYVSVPKNSAWAFGSNDFSINLWTKFNVVRSGAFGGLPNVFVGQDEGGSNLNKWVFYLADDGLDFHINGSVSAFIGHIPFSPTPGQWYHIAVNRSGSTYSFFVNGTLAGTAVDANPIPDVNAALTIGQAEGLGYFNGLIDELGIYNRSLTAGEIQTIYNAGSSGVCAPLATVTFASNGGSTVTSQLVPYNTVATIPAAPTRAGYTFTGWYSDAGLTTPFVFSTPVTADVTLYAQWNINSYTLTYTAGVNGTISGITPQNVNYSASGTAVTAVANSGYHFVQWSDGGTSAARTDNNITASLSVSATFASDPVNGVCDLATNGRTFVSPPTTSLCTVGAATAIGGTGPWSWSCLGLNGGNNAVCSASIDITGPVLLVSTLADGAITNNAILNISGTVSDVSGVASLTINAAPVTVTNGSFSHAVTLQPGSNINTTIATDTLGNSTTDSRTITLDVLAPVLTVTTPADNSKTAQSVATVTGTINQNSIVSVTVTVNNGTAQTASITGNSYSAVVNLSAGLNTIAITVTTTDVSGNISSAIRTVTYDSTNPSLAITSPNQDITTAQNSITISGTVSDIITSATVTLTFNNQTYTPAISNGTFTQQLTMPAEGRYPITATATDAGGNSSSVTRNVIYALDTAPPGIISFTLPATSGTPLVAITTLTAADTVGVTGYVLKDTPAPPLASDPVWSSTVPTTYSCRTWGNNTLYAYTKDAAGNISAPKLAVVLVGPTDGIIVPGPQKLEPTLPDAIKSLNFAMKTQTPTPAEFAGANVSPLVNGIPQPPGGKTTINLGDTIVTLRRVIGL